MLLKNKVAESLEYISARIQNPPTVAVVLGSGMGDFVDKIENAIIISTVDIPHYPVSTVPGHEGKWVFGTLNGVPLLAIKGRVHFYEGYSLQQVTYYVHLLAGLKISNLIVTTACGGLNPEFHPGDLMLIEDQINFAFHNPLIGKPDDQLGPRFPDMSAPYDENLKALAKTTAEKLQIELKTGTYCWVTGPSYETAAEVRMLQKIGGDAVSMSTAPEVIVAAQRHLKVMGISLITNAATGLSTSELSHDEVTIVANQAGEKLQHLISAIIAGIKK